MSWVSILAIVLIAITLTVIFLLIGAGIIIYETHKKMREMENDHVDFKNDVRKHANR